MSQSPSYGHPGTSGAERLIASSIDRYLHISQSIWPLAAVSNYSSKENADHTEQPWQSTLFSLEQHSRTFPLPVATHTPTQKEANHSLCWCFWRQCSKPSSTVSSFDPHHDFLRSAFKQSHQEVIYPVSRSQQMTPLGFILKLLDLCFSVIFFVPNYLQTE